MRRMVRGIVGLMLCSRCVTMSTPVRGLPGGMPDRVAHHQLEVGGVIGTIFGVDENGGHVLAPTIGGPQIAYGLLDNLVLEAGANLELVNLHWATHWVGARLVHRQPLGAWVFSADPPAYRAHNDESSGASARSLFALPDQTSGAVRFCVTCAGRRHPPRGSGEPSIGAPARSDCGRARR